MKLLVCGSRDNVFLLNESDLIEKDIFNSCGVTVAVPNFPTTIPAARLATAAASFMVARTAKASVTTAMTVSPAPETS